MSQYSDDVEVDETSEPAPDGLDPMAWYVTYRMFNTVMPYAA